MENRFFYSDWIEAKEKFPNVNYRYMMTLSNFFDTFLFFNRNTLDKMFEQGMKDAKNDHITKSL